MILFAFRPNPDGSYELAQIDTPIQLSEAQQEELYEIAVAMEERIQAALRKDVAA